MRDEEKTTPFVKDDPPSERGTKASEKSKRGDPYRDPAPPGTRTVGPMFGNFEAAKRRKLPRWAAPLLSAMLLFHVVLFVTMWVKTIWDIEQLERPKNSFDLAIASPPPPPPPPPKGGVKPKDVTITPKKIKVKDIVQPVKIEKQEVAAPVETGDPNGVEGGVEDGVAGGDLNGVVQAPPPPPPPPPPAPPQNVAPTALEASRVSGEKNIVPDDMTKTEISRSGKDKLVGTYKLCITADGNIKSVNQLKSTGFPAYDSKIQTTIRSEWRYRPFMVNGKAAEVCTAVTFIYSQK
jgi:periplasmic protein TonB